MDQNCPVFRGNINAETTRKQCGESTRRTVCGFPEYLPIANSLETATLSVQFCPFRGVTPYQAGNRWATCRTDVRKDH